MPPYMLPTPAGHIHCPALPFTCIHCSMTAITEARARRNGQTIKECKAMMTRPRKTTGKNLKNSKKNHGKQPLERLFVSC